MDAIFPVNDPIEILKCIHMAGLGWAGGSTKWHIIQVMFFPLNGFAETVWSAYKMAASGTSVLIFAREYWIAVRRERVEPVTIPSRGNH